ncbi:PhoH family protein [Sporosarcina sp. Sa2YVA2]|uniref:PhoH-like protein n=1 Tax=Sporosarcina quadrami TaxID=2762234 RepID=A0ABR8U5S6_9BACL|nr:PhoH family protein [Sporosarcina quadrami]MBD7983119.1 PhoH family protein [Sporosarcina quadrami]
MSEQTIQLHIEEPNDAVMLLGISDQNMKLIEESLNITIITRGDTISIAGEEKDITSGKFLLEQLLKVIRKGININLRDISTAVEMVKNETIEYFSELYDEEIARTAKGKAIRAKTIGQREYVHAIRQNDLVYCIGPAGTGKTYLAVVLAIQAMKTGAVKRIILTRPAVEAGESLGFLPGDLKEKVDPYLRPLYDALHDVLGAEHTERLMERGTIEIAPLAYMRGRTLDDAFVILDEAQNTTKAQMKMFLTRLGFGSKMVITGDKTQIDLPRGIESGLIASESILKNVKEIHFQYLEQGDVVRHPIVAKIIEAYENEQSS